jgi:hypothetical protein
MGTVPKKHIAKRKLTEFYHSLNGNNSLNHPRKTTTSPRICGMTVAEAILIAPAYDHHTCSEERRAGDGACEQVHFAPARLIYDPGWQVRSLLSGSAPPRKSSRNLWS